MNTVKMDNKIYEEALASALKRIEALEEFNKKYYSNQQPSKQYQQKSMTNATTGQVKYIRILGGDPWPEMTKQEAGKEIDRLLAIKEGRTDESDEPREIEVKEPKEVDTDDAGVDSEEFL